MPSSIHLNLSTLCRKGLLKEALHILLTTHNPPVRYSIYLQLLQICIAKNVLSEGKKIHSLITERQFAFVTRTSFHNKLVDMYGKCGSLVDAGKVFDDMKAPNSGSWNAIIAAYRRHGYPHEAFKLFHQMQRTGFQPNSFTFTSMLPACAKLRALKPGLEFHESIIEMGFLSDVVVASALLDMYGKCGSLHKARQLFEKIPQKNVVSWNAMIVAYVQNGHLNEALKLFAEMPEKNPTSWNAMVAGYARYGFVEKALETYKLMELARVKPKPTTFASILPCCAKLGALDQGMDIHKSIIESGFLSDVVVVNALIDMYAKCGSIEKARELFDEMPQRDVISWNALIAGYTQSGALDQALSLFKEMPQRNVVSWNVMIAAYAHNGFSEEALETFKQMQLADVKPDSVTFVSVLPLCSKLESLEQGMDIHQRIIKNGFLSVVIVANSLIDMYAKCGSIHKARVLFDQMLQRDVVSWNAMIAGYSQSGDLDQVLRLFAEMPQRNVVSWNAMMAGYVQNGFVEKALEAFNQMRLAGLKPNSATFASILPACAEMGALEHGIGIHQIIVESGVLTDVVVASALLDMYAKCGSIHKARELFDKMPTRNVISWNAMISGYAHNGFCKDSLKLFELMKHSETYPDHVSFAGVLVACSHAGLVDEGCKHFNGMSDTYCIVPTIDHYVCIVDLLGRAGYLEETLNFVIKIPVNPVAVVWMCLLGACRSHKNVELGLFTATLLFEMDPKNDAAYVLLSNIYAEVGRWSEVQKVRKLMKDRGIKKIPASSWIEDHKMLHAFCVGNDSHSQIQEL